MLPPVVVVSLPTKNHTLVSFNRVIIVASGQISRDTLCVPVDFTIDAKKELKPEQQCHWNARRVIMLPPMLVLSVVIKKHTLVGFNRVIIVASRPISGVILYLGQEITIDAKTEMRQEQQ